MRALHLPRVLLLTLLGVTPLAAQEGLEASAEAALLAALRAACRHDEAEFARYLTQDNAAAYRDLAPGQRLELMRRLVRVSQPGRPRITEGTRGEKTLTCEAAGALAELRLGAARLRDNLAFVPVTTSDERRIEFGLVREGGGWRLLSVGLLLLDIPALVRQWEATDLEAREQAAIQALRRLRDAIRLFRETFGKLPERLEQLGPAPPEGISPNATELVEAELASGRFGGYVFRYRILPPPDQAADPNPPVFELAATPADYGRTGRRSFYLDSNGVLRGGDKQGAVATAADPRLEEGKKN